MPYGSDYNLFNDFSNNNYTSSFSNLFDRNEPFDLGIDDEELRKAQEEITKAKTAESEKKQLKADRKARLIEALPYIAAALTAKDEGQLQRALLAFADLKAQTRQRQETIKAQSEAQEREARLKELEREDTQEFNREMFGAEKEFRVGERLAGQEFSTGEREASQSFELRRDQERFVQDLGRMGYSNELAVEMEGLQQKYRLEAQRQGFGQNLELQTRLIARDLAGNMIAQGLRADTAASIADKVSRGTPAGQLTTAEQMALNHYTALNKANTEQERNAATIDTLYKLNNVEIPIEGARPELNPFTGKVEVPTRKLNADELLPFVFEDPESALRGLITPKDPRTNRTSTGETAGEVLDRSAYVSSAEATAKDPILQSAAARIPNDTAAAEFAVGLYNQYGLDGAKGAVDALQVDPKFRPLMIRAIEEADIVKKQREEMLNSMNFNPGSVQGTPPRF